VLYAHKNVNSRLWIDKNLELVSRECKSVK
jgi:hypothetical protein